VKNPSHELKPIEKNPVKSVKKNKPKRPEKPTIILPDKTLKNK
tara:strand:+ start:19086 stop:19214 length:129 start_codon:yes stop_codon:yes gene_type:complete